jgi:hypothetical protein
MLAARVVVGWPRDRHSRDAVDGRGERSPFGLKDLRTERAARRALSPVACSVPGESPGRGAHRTSRPCAPGPGPDAAERDAAYVPMMNPEGKAGGFRCLIRTQRPCSPPRPTRRRDTGIKPQADGSRPVAARAVADSQLRQRLILAELLHPGGPAPDRHVGAGEEDQSAGDIPAQPRNRVFGRHRIGFRHSQYRAERNDKANGGIRADREVPSE